MRMLVRTDSSRLLGSGHLMRCLTLARELRAHGVALCFACRELDGNFSTLAAAEFDLLPLPGGGDWSWQADLAAVQTAVGGTHFDACIVDHYALDARWETGARTFADRIIVIDDLADRPHAANVLLDQNLAAQPDHRYDALTPSTCLRLLGPRYALLAPAFAELRDRPRKKAGVPRILLSFGGSDPARLTLPVLQTVLAANLGPVTVDVVIGAQCADRGAIEACAMQDGRVFCHVATTRMAELMAAASVFVGAGGATSWERCCLGLPSVIVAVSDNQICASQILADAGAQMFLGASGCLDLQAYASAVALILQAPQLAECLGRRAATLVDGLGSERVAKALLQPVIRLREATCADADALYQWRNHPEVRQYAGDSREIAPDQHVRWLRTLLSDDQRKLLIGEDTDGPLGVLRYDGNGDAATVSIYLLPTRLGQGGGAHLLNAGEQWLGQHWPRVRQIRAVIHADNSRSLHMFAAAGYQAAEHQYIKQLEPKCRANHS